MNRFLTLSIMAVIAASANAEINFSAPEPPINKYVEITTEGINLREKPSTSSNKLVWECNGDSDDCQYLFKAKGDGVHPMVGETLPYISEDGDWVNFTYCGNFDLTYPVWTLKKFVKELDEPGPLTAKEKDKLEIWDIPSMPGYALWVHQGEFDENDLYIGRKVGDKYIFVYSVPMPWYAEEQEKSLERSGDDDAITYNKSLTCCRVYGDWVDERHFNISALSKEQIEWIFEKACKSKPYAMFLINKYGIHPFYPN